MSNENYTTLIVGVLVIAGIVALGLVWRGCGQEVNATCPNGGKVELKERGTMGASFEGICKQIEEDGD